MVYNNNNNNDNDNINNQIIDNNHWLYLAESLYQGSSYPESDSCLWDICALSILAPIEPIMKDIFPNQIRLLHKTSLSSSSYSNNSNDYNSDYSVLNHPYMNVPTIHR